MKSIERILLLLLVVAFVFDRVSTAKAGGDPRVVEGREFNLVTDLGKTIGSFHISSDGEPELVLSDAKGHGRVVIALRRSGDAIIGLTDTSGTVRAGMIGESNGHHSVQLSDESTPYPRLAMSVASKGYPRFYVSSSKRKELVNIGIDEQDNPRFTITNVVGNSRLEYEDTDPAGRFGLYLMTEGATHRAGIELDGTAVAHVFAQDDGAKARAELQAPATDEAASVSLRDRYGKKVPVK